jgi:hypothetical protein
MIALEQLDLQLDKAEQELAELEHQGTAAPSKLSQEVLAKAVLVHAEEEELERLIDHGRLAEATEISIPPLPRSIMFWAREYGERMEDYATRYGDYLQKLLWLNLFRGRLLGQKRPFRLNISERDVRAMLQSKQKLEKREKTLQDDVRRLQQVEQELRLRYDNHQHQASAKEAALSFAVSPRTMLGQGNTMEAFASLLRTMAAHSTRDPNQVKTIQRVTVSIARRSQNLMERCSELLREGIKGQRRRALKENLAEMQRLETEIEMTLSLLTPTRPPQRPSLMVKKLSKEATTARHTLNDPSTGASYGQHPTPDPAQQ